MRLAATGIVAPRGGGAAAAAVAAVAAASDAIEVCMMIGVTMDDRQLHPGWCSLLVATRTTAAAAAVAGGEGGGDAVSFVFTRWWQQTACSSCQALCN
jgi:hypothetical protein